MKLLGKIKEFFRDYQEPRYRDRRGFNASELTKDARDLYWRLTGEPETNPSDLTGRLRMMFGNALERGIVYEVLMKMHFFGLHVVGTQVDIGGSDPVAVNGKLDALLVERDGDDFGKPYVLEIKSKWGWGADIFCDQRDPGENYMAQLGYYLRDLNAKGVTNRGMFLFVPVSNNTFGDLIAVYCEYDAKTDTITAYESQSIHEESPRPLGITYQLTPALERLVAIQGYVDRKELPPADKQYKYPLTPALLDETSDSNLRKAAKNEKVLGDWEIAYSNYKALHIREQGGVAGYTDAELELLNDECARRWPNGASAKAKKKVG